MPKNKLFDEESEEEVALKIENEYAKRYDKWREKEELHKLEQKYGSKALTSDASSDSEDESDEPPDVSEDIEAQFLKTLALLKTKDPRIYDPNFKFFDEQPENKEELKPKAKTLTFEDSDESDDDGNIFTIEKKAEIITDTKQDKKDDMEGNLKDYLTGKAEHVNTEVEKDLAPLKALWSDPKLNENEAFLRDYILNKKYLEEVDTMPADKILDDEELEEDEKRVEEQGKFERAYNFRFEEPDEEYLKRFPRTMNYIRPKDDRRSKKRAEIRDRKEEEKKRKMEEIARMKALKLKEIQEKISKIKEVTGNKDLAFEEEDIEGDFDPEEHDRRMKAIFDEQFYHEADDEKPVFPDFDDELEIENWEKFEKSEDATQEQGDDEEPHCEDDSFNMDADFDPKAPRANLLEELEKTLGKKRRNRKKKSKLAKILAEEKPKFVPTVEKSYDEYMEEYYKMDCEDVIGGDLPTRFKYRQVLPNDYGLSIEEILLADDKELTQWVPLKKIVRHRPVEVEKSEVNNFKQKASDVTLKRKILPSLFKELPEEPEIAVPLEETIKKKKKKNKRKKENNTAQNIHNETEEPIKNNENNEAIDGENQEDSLGNEENKAKRKKKKRRQKETASEEDGTEITEENNKLPNENCVSSEPNKKKKKNKHKVDDDNKLPTNKDANVSDVVNKDKEIINREGSMKKSKKNEKQITDGFTVENVNAGPSKVGSVETPKSKNLKRKLDINTPVPNKKKKNKANKKDFAAKYKRNDPGQDKDKRPSNPLTNLSDERLKAYGLNPKKYRSFLKYKKF